MRPFVFTWVSCHIVRAVGFLLFMFAIYAFIPSTPLPALAPTTSRWLLALMSLGYGALLVTAAESWLVWLQTERNTAEVVERLKRLERLLEREPRQRRAN